MHIILCRFYYHVLRINLKAPFVEFGQFWVAKTLFFLTLKRATFNICKYRIQNRQNFYVFQRTQPANTRLWNARRA